MPQEEPAELQVGDRRIGTGQPCFVAEAGVNHDSDPELAHRLVEVAAETADGAVKFPTSSRAVRYELVSDNAALIVDTRGVFRRGDEGVVKA